MNPIIRGLAIFATGVVAGSAAALGIGLRALDSPLHRQGRRNGINLHIAADVAHVMLTGENTMRLDIMRTVLFDLYAVAIPQISIVVDKDAEAGRYQITHQLMTLAQGKIDTNRILVRASTTELDKHKLICRAVTDPFTGLSWSLAEKDQADRVMQLKLPVGRSCELIEHHVMGTVLDHAHQWLDTDAAEHWLTNNGFFAHAHEGELDWLKLPLLTKVLVSVVRRRIAINNVGLLRQMLVSAPAAERNHEQLVERIALALAKGPKTY